MTLLVVELNSFHLELLPMYRPLLPSLFGEQLDIRYVVLPTLVDRARDIVGNGADALSPRWLKYVLPLKPLRAIYYVRRIQQLIDRIQPAAVLFNTIEPVAYFRVFRQIRHHLKIGVVHNPKREGIDYSPRASGELIFCLHDYNYHLLEPDKPVDGYFSPFFKYREVDTAPRSNRPLEIAVQGVISFNRRDYTSLLSLCEHVTRHSGVGDIVFNIVGDARLRDGPTLVRLVRERGLGEWFRFHAGLSDSQFFDELAQADFLMPLLNARSDSYAGAAKVTAAYGHSGAYRTPMILDRETADLWGIPDDACLAFERLDDLADRLASAAGERAEMATRYGRLIEQKIHQNRSFLQMFSRQHPALAGAVAE